MGIDKNFERAFAKALIAAGQQLPTGGKIFISVKDEHKEAVVAIAKLAMEVGFDIIATEGTQKALAKGGVESKRLLKISEGRPNAGDLITNKELGLIFVTTQGDEPDVRDGRDLRRQALAYSVPVITTLPGMKATLVSIKAFKEGGLEQVPLQDYF